MRPSFDVAIPGFYAWVATVAVPVHQADGNAWPIACSWLALLCLVVASGCVAAPRWRAWSAVAVTAFVMSSASVWFLTAPLEVPLGFLGSLGWAAFAIGWVRAAEAADLTVGTAVQRLDLLPRHRTHLLSWLTMGIGMVGAMLVWGLAWSVEGRERSLLGQATAVLGALSLLTATATHASAVGRQAVGRPFSKARLGRTLGLLGLVLFGCWLTFLRA